MLIARRAGEDLARLLDEGYGLERPEDLTIAQASELIDRLKAAAIN